MLSLLILSLVILLPRSAFPTPLPQANNNTIETTGWRSEPATRGTFRLIFSCLTTLTTCVYTAVHLNIPKENTSTSARYLRKAGWVVIGILAPEFVVYTAWAQWHSAKKLMAVINNLIDEKANDSPPGDNFSHERWTMTQAFYANMGGFVLETKPLPPDGKEYIPESPRLTVTARGIHFLALNGIFASEAESFIVDKSKTNSFAKIFTCMQGGWLVIQCIARLCYQLPITLLEINTVGHVLCAFATYVFWFFKPLDINEPTVISGEKFENLGQVCALMWMSSSVGSKAIKRPPEANKEGSELESLFFYDLKEDQSVLRVGWPFTTIVQLPSSEETTSHIYQFQIPDGTGFAINPESARFFLPSSKFAIIQVLFMVYGQKIESDKFVALRVELDDTDIQRWKMASRVLEANPMLLGDAYFKNPVLKPPTTFEGWRFKELVCERCPDWPGHDLVGRETTLVLSGFNWLSLVLPLATAVYGGLHSAAWNGYFPTPSERKLWRYSSIIAAASGSVFITLTILSYLIKRQMAMAMKSEWVFVPLVIQLYLLFFSGFGLTVPFVASRMFLVIEAFVSIRKLPVAAYDTPRWLQSIPHI